jgi:tetratricopeptide (TPR) repeat protein
MKRHIQTALLLAVGLLFSSCSDSFLQQYPSNNITEGNFYQTDNDFNQAVRGCYARLKTQLSFHLNTVEYRSDENQLTAMAVSNQASYDIDHFIEKPNNSILSDVWTAWYSGIYRCNDVLVHMDGAQIDNANQYRGECLFLRSWFYFNLYRTFGVVPLTRTVVSPEEAQRIPRCTDAEMYALLVEDLTEAASLLPESRSAEVARVTKIGAWALLGKVHLTFGHKDEAKKALEQAMTYKSYGLESSVARVFDTSNKMNKEIIFAVYYNKSTDSGHGYWYSASTNVLADINNPTMQFKSIYSTSDARYDLINSYVEVTKNKLYALRKWYDTYDATYTTVVGNDFPHLRYADVLLMYAEAISETNLSGAIDYLNMTRTRAGLAALTAADISTQSQFVEELALERGREFALEGQRWFDLVRLGLAIDYFRSLGYTLDDHNLIFPIPQDQIEIVNDNSILWQNPGYNS